MCNEIIFVQNIHSVQCWHTHTHNRSLQYERNYIFHLLQYTQHCTGYVWTNSKQKEKKKTLTNKETKPQQQQWQRNKIAFCEEEKKAFTDVFNPNKYIINALANLKSTRYLHALHITMFMLFSFQQFTSLTFWSLPYFGLWWLPRTKGQDQTRKKKNSKKWKTIHIARTQILSIRAW